MKMASVDQIHQIERRAAAMGVTYEAMMQRAGESIAAWVANHVKSPGLRVTGLVGAGNNGGDTLICLLELKQKGWTATAYLARPRPEDDPLLLNFKSQGGIVIDPEEGPDFETLKASIAETDVLIDGMLGTGVKLPIKPPLDRIMAAARKIVQEREDLLVVAVDCPSGIDCDTGEAADNVIPANVTICLAVVKQGLLKMPAFMYAGKIIVGEIGLPDGLPELAQLNRCLISGAEIQGYLPARPLDAHKGTFGTAMIIAGCINYTGAAFLSAKAAYRSGAGLVTLGVVPQVYAALAGHLPEVTWLILPEEMGVISSVAADVVLTKLERITAILVGPGLGQDDQTSLFIKRLFSQTPVKKDGHVGFMVAGQVPANALETRHLPPAVIDADGLRLVSQITGWEKAIPELSVLTPHPGEMAALTGLLAAEIQADRIEIAERCAAAWGHVIVLKGALTVIAEPAGRTGIIPVATPALARAGTGDVLAGIICGLRAQGVGAYEAAAAGAWLHAQAGLEAVVQLGSSASVLAGDVLDALPRVLARLD